MPNLHRLAGELEKVRALTGKPLKVVSGYRCKRLNAAVGGQPHSYHLDGLAADFQPPPGWTHDALQQAIAADPAIAFDLIMEEATADGKVRWLHFQVSREGETPRRMVRDAVVDKVGGKIQRTIAG
jgi:hypothetical protein